MQLQARSQMDPQYQWDLTHIFADDAAWETAYGAVEQAIPALQGYQGTLHTAEGAAKALNAYYALAQQAERVYLYAELRKSGDNGDDDSQAMQDRAMRLLVSLGATTSYITPELAALPAQTLETYLRQDLLKPYHHAIADIIRGRAHVLGAEQERMLALLADAAQTPDNGFTMLSEVDMTFPPLQSAQGAPLELTHGNFAVYRESEDRALRQAAFETYFGEFNKYIHTFAALYGGSVKQDNYFAEVRGYEGALHQALFAHAVPTQVYDSLIQAVHAGLPAMRKYLALRKRVLGVEELHMYDLYCPMVPDVEASYTLPQAKATVKEALRPLGPQYAGLLDTAFAGRWIDAYENKGKTTGAFSCGVYGVHPYVLLNYTSTLNDVFTMAHELGHALHSHFSDSAQDYANHDYAIMVAEVASTVNEVLLTKHLLAAETDARRRAYYLNHYLEGFRTTLFRQTLFAEFEKRAHEMAQKGEPLTAQTLNALYRGLNELYYEGACVDALQDMEWARIPHFYNAFYVYQYATGYSAAVDIAERITNSGDASGYLRFLQTGGSAYPIEELKLAGVDLSEPRAVQHALSAFSACVDELEALLNTL
ncbi:MAG: oligoendopeptidase F [Christensenellaceae bacterium]|jgi:oligoendopeptidase F|nr:oligoendopeptidase F [Christensenellaceae bacterium]